MKKLAFFVTLLVVVAIGVVIVRKRIKPMIEVQNVATTEVKRGPFVVKITEPGEAQPVNARTITAPISGEIARMVPEGTRVKAGDPVVWLDTTQIERQLVDAEAALLAAQNAYEQKKATVNLQLFMAEMAIESANNEYQLALSQKERADVELKKKEVLLKNQLASESDERQAKLAAESAALRVKNALMNIKKATEDYKSGKIIYPAGRVQAEVDLKKNEQNVALLKDQMKKAVVRAEGPGLVVYSTIYRGGQRTKLQEGDQVYRNSTIAQLPDFSAIKVSLYVKEVDINRVEVGQHAIVRVEAYPDLALNGKVTEVSKVANKKRGFHSSSDGTSSFGVNVLVDGTDKRIRPGMTVYVDIIIDKIDDCVYVPQETVFQHGDRQVVYVQTDGGFEEREVTLGKRNENYVVIESGLDGTERICLRDPSSKLETFGSPSK